MPDKQALYTLLNLKTGGHAPVFIIYAEQPSQRLSYTCEFIFNHVLKVDFQITHDLGSWQNSEHYKISYSTKPAGDVFQILPHALLFEKNISGIKPVPFFKNNQIYFYENNNGDLHFDVFAAAFYFISRYEEWQPFKRDRHNRFEVTQSILYSRNFHLKPVADTWVYELKSALEKKHPGLVFPALNYKVMSTIDVDNLYAFKAKGFLRTIGAGIKDLIRFDFENLSQRAKVLAGSKKDPFDVYEDISRFCKELNFPLIFFFLFKNGTKYDRTVNPQSPAFKKAFSALKQHNAFAGIHPSYDSAFRNNMLKNEVSLLSEKSGERIIMSRQHFLRFDIRTTPMLLMQQGIIADFTMGYASSPGFRAGTSHPFFYYNFNTEAKEELLFVPFCAMDGAYFVYDKADPETALQSLYNLAFEIKKVNGLFVTVFHERTFSNHLYGGFSTLYKNLYLKLKDL